MTISVIHKHVYAHDFSSGDAALGEKEEDDILITCPFPLRFHFDKTIL